MPLWLDIVIGVNLLVLLVACQIGAAVVRRLETDNDF